MKWLLSIPLHFVAMAVLFVVGYLVTHMLGWRDYTAILSGTSHSGSPEWDVLRASVYLVFYFGFVVFSPILVLAAGVLALLERLFLGRNSTPHIQ